MRSLLLVLLVLLFTACDTRTREERALDRAQQKLEEAREDLAEARERMRDEMDEARDRADEARDRVEEAGGTNDLMKAIGSALEEVGRALKNDPDAQPVDFRKLRDLLPGEIDGMERIDVEGENAGAIGIRISRATARYDGLGRDLELSLIDLGTLHRAAEEGLDALDAHVDREWEDGYERTTEIQGHPAHIKVHRHGSSTDLEATILVGGRFVVHVEADGRGVSEELVEEVMEGVGRLTRLG
jgi:hypothetical protein